jgi:hypothetical protein
MFAKKRYENSLIEECEESFKKSNEFLNTASILAFLDFEEELLVCTNANREGVGGVRI